MVRRPREQFGKAWMQAAGIRALKTFFQTAVAVLSVSATATVLQANWLGALDAGLMAAIFSVLYSCAGLPEIKVPSNRN